MKASRMSEFKRVCASLNWSFKQGFIKAFELKSRATRMEYWTFTLTTIFIFELLARFADIYFFPGDECVPLSTVVSIIILFLMCRLQYDAYMMRIGLLGDYCYI
jgi:uncharacterized membrane protein YhaH (DUF805 family)